MIPTINKSTRVTRTTATAIDHFISNRVADAQLKKEIIQTDLSDHFPIIFPLQTNYNVVETYNERFVYKRYYGEKSIILLKQKLHWLRWDKIKNIKEPNEGCRKYLKVFSWIYETFSPKIELE